MPIVDDKEINPEELKFSDLKRRGV